MNIALIFAGGTGQRMNTKTVPKQFLELHGKPILIYTLDLFESHSEIDGIVVVCLASWIERLKAMLRKYGITKVRSIVPGGMNGQESIFHGLEWIHAHCPEDTIVLVHDGVRPLIEEQTISDDLECVRKHGNAITVAAAQETVTIDNNGIKVGTIVNRSQCKLARAPQCFRIGELYIAHQRAREENRQDFIDSASLMQYYGHELFMVEGPAYNLKITTPTDYYIFRALKDAMEDSQIFGL